LVNNVDKYKMTFDYHTHTTFSHGKGSIEDNVKAAIAQGLKAIAISDHGPGHLTYGVKRKDFPVMRDEIERLKLVYPEINIYLSVEANIVSTGTTWTLRKQKRNGSTSLSVAITTVFQRVTVWVTGWMPTEWRQLLLENHCW